MYAVGLCAAAVPVGMFASAAGVKRSALAGLLGLASTSVAFGLVDSYWELLVTRLLQGAAQLPRHRARILLLLPSVVAGSFVLQGETVGRSHGP